MSRNLTQLLFYSLGSADKPVTDLQQLRYIQVSTFMIVLNTWFVIHVMYWLRRRVAQV